MERLQVKMEPEDLGVRVKEVGSFILNYLSFEFHDQSIARNSKGLSDDNCVQSCEVTVG